MIFSCRATPLTSRPFPIENAPRNKKIRKKANEIASHPKRTQRKRKKKRTDVSKRILFLPTQTGTHLAFEPQIVDDRTSHETSLPKKGQSTFSFFSYFYFLPKWKFFYHVFFYELALRRAYSVAIGDRGKKKEKEKRKEKKEKKRISQENSQQFPSPASQSSFGCCGKGLAALPCCVSWTTLPGWSLFFRQYFTILRSWVLMRFVFQWGKRCNNMETFLNRRISSPTEQVFRAERQSRVDYSSPECIPKMKKKNKNKNKKKELAGCPLRSLFFVLNSKSSQASQWEAKVEPLALIGRVESGSSRPSGPGCASSIRRFGLSRRPFRLIRSA